MICAFRVFRRNTVLTRACCNSTQRRNSHKNSFCSTKQPIVALARKIFLERASFCGVYRSHPDDIQLFFCCRLLFFQPGAQLGTDLEYGQEGGSLKTRWHFQTGRDEGSAGKVKAGGFYRKTQLSLKIFVSLY